MLKILGITQDNRLTQSKKQEHNFQELPSTELTIILINVANKVQKN